MAFFDNDEEENKVSQSTLNPDVESYLRQLGVERQRTQDPAYQAALSSQRSQQYSGDMAPQRLAAYGQALSQIGTLGGKAPGTQALNQYAGSIQQEQNLSNQRDLKDQDEKDKQTGLYMKTLQFLDEKKRKQEEAELQRGAAASLQQDKLDAQRERLADRAAMVGAVGGATSDMKQAMFDLKKDEFEERKQARLDKMNQEKMPNKDQFTAGAYGKRVEQANQIMDDLSKGGYNRASTLSGLASYLPGAIQGEKSKQQEQAERNFVNAILRRESGAAIAESEFDSAQKQYFPRSGDTPAVLAQKNQNRQQAQESLKAESGNAWQKIPSVALTRPATDSMFSESKAQAAPAAGAPPPGTKKSGYIFKGGDPANPSSWEKE